MASNRPESPAKRFRTGTNDDDDPSDITKIMEEFHCIYNERLKTLISEGECNEKKIPILQEWVRDLTDQNRMLVKTVEQLEKNAEDRVDTLDNVLKVKAAEKQEPQTCKDCPSLNERFKLLQEELNCARASVAEKECMITEYIQQNEELNKALCEAQANASNVNYGNTTTIGLEDTIVTYKRKLCQMEKALQTRLDEIECLQATLKEKDRINQLLKTEAEKARSIPKMQEAIGLLRDAVKEKDNILESYYQELTYMKDKITMADEQECKLLQLEDNLKYCEQTIKQKDCMLEKLKEHIRQLRQTSVQNHDPQYKGNISRSSSTEENYYNSSEVGSASSYINEELMAAGDSALVEELKKKLANEKDMQVALTSEVAEKHDAIMRLKEHVRELEEQLRQSDMQTHFKDDIIRQLRKEVKLGRAKESLAEMLGLKGGPRAQMKAKIDNLHSELEEREIEISRLEGKLEASRLPAVEAKLNRLEVELVDRERSVLALCDKLDYVRKYLSKLRGSEEDISIKCGLEALLLELSEDVEWTREARRNVSIPINDDPKESVIIINHRSHSLPDTTLQKQVQAFKMNTEYGMMYENEKQNFKEMSECSNLKEEITSLGSGLTETLSQLGTIWDSMKKCELECGDSVMRLTQEVQNTVENEHSQLLQVNNEMQNIADRINELTALGENNDYILHCLEKCLIEALDLLNKQKETMGFIEPSFSSLNGDCDIPANVKAIVCAEVHLNDAMSLLLQLKSTSVSKDASKTELSACKTKEMNNIVNAIISSKQNVVDQLYLVHLTQEEIAKRIFKKFNEFDKIFGNHQDIVGGLRVVLNHFIFNDFISKSSKQDLVEYKKNGEGQRVNVSNVKELNALKPESGDCETNRIKALKRNRLSRSSPSIGEEYESDILGDIHVKSAHLQQIALSLNEELKSYLKEVFLREDKVRQFVCESQELNKTLDNLSKELCGSEKILKENSNNLSLQPLQAVLSQAQTEVELLLCKTEDFTRYKEMYDMNRSKMEQEIQALQKDMFTIVSDIMDAIKASQDYDNNLLNSYRNKIQNYREKVEQLEKHLTNSIDKNELDDKDDEEDLVCKLSDKIEKYQSEVEQLRRSINIVKKDKEAIEMENQKVMEELQAKIKNR
ncbi:hypothetical protein O3M35_005743 [Rhynocoris fuscipes]|uniref:Uncharacterized protein n=1 Tax=Rhynocoris fuscipes TaxID=488301 RepID=A0AAW1DN19_9HEMI